MKLVDYILPFSVGSAGAIMVISLIVFAKGLCEYII